MQTKKSPKADAPTAVKQKSLAKLKLLLDLAQLEHRCKADTSTLLELFGPTHAGGYAYKDNGSDVLDDLGCQCCNVGVGYYNEHTDRCHMVVDDYLKQLVRFRRMWTAHHKTHYPYSKIEERNWSGQLTTRDDVYECPHCLCQFFDWETVITETHILCPDCGLKAALAF